MSIILRTDVTAVKFFGDCILAGIGSSVNVFEKNHGQLIQRINALNGQKVYGFASSTCGYKLLVYGGKQFTLLLYQDNDHHYNFLQLFTSVECDDWLQSGICIDVDRVALLTAHNVVQVWDTTNQVLVCKHASKDNSILYTGLLLPLSNEILVFAGTVFSEVIINIAGDDKALHHLKEHQGVIFSIACYPENGIIVTTSDDRSTRIWEINNKTPYSYNTRNYWQNVNIICKHTVYGHTARVMRSCITNKFVITVGEDSAVCFWDHKGNLLKKNIVYQNGGIWSVDSDESHLVTGGGDAGIILHPLSVASDYGQSDIINLRNGNPKKMVFTARNNIIVLLENDELIYYDLALKEENIICKLNHQSTYKLLSISSCKQIIAVADMEGTLDVFIENCKYEANIQNVIRTNIKIGKILSLQWAGNRNLVLCSGSGLITVLASNGNSTETYATFMLPQCKERWLTASAIDITNNVIVVGDRCGNVHVYHKDQRDPIRTFPKVHGRYGPTSITIKTDEIITTGRDGTIKHFTYSENTANIQYMCSRDLEFQWVEKFLDKEDIIVCGFHERVFVLYNIVDNMKLLEVPCGGGHRSWDAVRYITKLNNTYEEIITLAYVKNSHLHVTTFELSKIISKNIVNGSHSKEINALISMEIDKISYFISGGEDTTLRISSLKGVNFQDEIIFKNLSSVRTLKVCLLGDKKFLLISAGGRAQISIKSVEIKIIDGKHKIKSQAIIDYLIKGIDKDRTVNRNWRTCSVDFDPETRVMDVDFIKVNENNFIIFAGCSDACLRVFNLNYNSKSAFKLNKELKYHKTCILKTTIIFYKEIYILVTCTTIGEVAFWDVSNLTDLNHLQPFFNTVTNKSGINSISYTVRSEQLIIATGGDDNSIHMNVIEKDQHCLSSMRVSHRWSTDQFHCSQITGLSFVDNHLISTSIDQRITLLEWKIEEYGIDCRFISQTYSDVADIQGMDILSDCSDSVTVCVFGKGMEVIKLLKPNHVQVSAGSAIRNESRTLAVVK